jgi:hypothetical protein
MPGDIMTLLKWIPLVSNRVDVWKESAARAGAAQALEFVLSWYPGVKLDQLEHLREGGLVGLDEAKLRQRARTIVECANTSLLFDTRESDEYLDDVDFEEPSSAEVPQKASEDPTDSSIPPYPSGDNFVLAARTGNATLLEPAAPDCVKVSLLVCMCIELMPCLVTFRSCVPMTFHPKFLMHRFLVVCEPDLT